MSSAQQRQQLDGWQRLLFWLPVALFLLLYAATAQRGVAWQDSGEFQYRVLIGDYIWHGGLARAHPLYIAAARNFAALWPFGLRLYAINLFSGLGMVVALALLGRLLLAVTGHLGSALLAMVLLGGTQMCWWLATMAEVYTWSLAAMLGELYLLWRYYQSRTAARAVAAATTTTVTPRESSRRWLVALAALNGLHFAIHNLALLNLALYLALAVIDQVRRRRDAVPATAALSRHRSLPWLLAGVWLVAAAPLLLLALQEWHASGALLKTLQGLLFGDRYQSYVVGLWPRNWRQVGFNWGLAALSLLNPLPFMAALGLRRYRTDAATRLLLAATLLHALFWLRYFVPDQATFILPTLGLLALWAGLGLPAWLGSGRRALQRGALLLSLALLTQLGIPLLMPAAIARTGIDLTRARALPGRNEVAYWAQPWQQHEQSAARFITAVVDQMEHGEWLVADATAAGALLAAGAAGLLPYDREWHLVTPWNEAAERSALQQALQGGAAIYVVSPGESYTPAWLLEQVDSWQREGVLYRRIVR